MDLSNIDLANPLAVILGAIIALVSSWLVENQRFKNQEKRDKKIDILWR
ncbi:hypothetical protein [Alkalihalobacillus trypoxylicola]|nr:hypothetical protein [Alkalihalobacillus trypoxylicola]